MLHSGAVEGLVKASLQILMPAFSDVMSSRVIIYRSQRQHAPSVPIAPGTNMLAGSDQ